MKSLVYSQKEFAASRGIQTSQRVCSQVSPEPFKAMSLLGLNRKRKTNCKTFPKFKLVFINPFLIHIIFANLFPMTVNPFPIIRQKVWFRIVNVVLIMKFILLSYKLFSGDKKKIFCASFSNHFSIIFVCKEATRPKAPHPTYIKKKSKSRLLVKKKMNRGRPFASLSPKRFWGE